MTDDMNTDKCRKLKTDFEREFFVCHAQWRRKMFYSGGLHRTWSWCRVAFNPFTSGELTTSDNFKHKFSIRVICGKKLKKCNSFQ